MDCVKDKAFENPLLKEEARLLKEIDENLEIKSITFEADNKTPKNISIELFLKGNSKLIRKLEAFGWYKANGYLIDGKKAVYLKKKVGDRGDSFDKELYNFLVSADKVSLTNEETGEEVDLTSRKEELCKFLASK